MSTFARLIEGPFHEGHGPQTQVGWLGHADGKFYAWDDEPRDREPGGYSPVFIDREIS